MPSVEELLNLDEQIETYAEENEELVIDIETRTINIPISETLFGVKGDKNIERKYFRCPKIVGDNIDLSKHLIYIAYVYSENTGSIFPTEGIQPYHCDDVMTDGEDITFSWKLSDHVFQSAGFIAFKMYAKEKEDSPYTVFNTAPAIGTVLYTIDDGVESVVSEHPDIINQLLAEMESVQEIATPEAMQRYVNDYLEDNPIEGGMTAEQEQQLEQNTTDIADLKSAINEKWTDISPGEIFEISTNGNDNVYKLEGLAAYFDFTKYPDGYSGDVEDLSGNNTEIMFSGLDLYESGRNGFVNGKLMINNGPLSNAGGSKVTIKSEAIHTYPFSIEIYAHLRRDYNPYAGSGTLGYQSTDALKNYEATLFSTRYSSIFDETSTINGLTAFANKEKIGITGSANTPNISENAIGFDIDGIENENISDRYDHIVVCFDSNKQKFYLNNELIIDKKETSVGLSMSSVLRIFPNLLKGDIKLIRIYNDILSDNDVEMNYSNALGDIENEI